MLLLHQLVQWPVLGLRGERHMKIYVFPADRFGCGYYRLIWPAEELRRRGHDVVIIDPADRERHQVFGADVGANGHVVRAWCPDDADLLVFQRVTHIHLAEAIAYLVAARKVRVVMDMDDDLAAIDPNNPAFTMLFHRNFGFEADRSKHSWRVTQTVARWVNLVTVSTPGLVQRYGAHGRVRVLENRVPARYLDVPHDPHDGPLGWPASMHSHPHDPTPARHAVSRLVREGVPFVTFGDRRGAGRAFSLEKDPPGPGDVELHDWARVVATLRVGIVPLADTLFNERKSWLKGAELAAVGVPWVASPTAENRRLAKLLGAGYIATKKAEWYRLTRRLWDEPNLRVEQSAALREGMRALTIEAGAEHWADAWESAMHLEPRLRRLDDIGPRSTAAPVANRGGGQHRAPGGRRVRGPGRPRTTPPPEGGGGLIGEVRRVPRST
jgi:hypothetical protein